MTYKEYTNFVKADLFRVTGSINTKILIRKLFFGEAFKYIFWMRTTKYTSEHKVLRYLMFPIARLMLEKYIYKFGISISYNAEIGRGLLITHFGAIVVSGKAIIGNNCNISHGVTIGKTNRGSKKGAPVIGNGVYLGPGAKIIENIRIGNNVAVGANCVVTKDVPDNAVVVGIPGKVISNDGAAGYINNQYQEESE